MDKQKLFSLTRQAIERYNMIEEGDRIAIGLSGGKDSLTLLTVLSGLQKFYPKKFELMGITCDVGFEGMDFHPDCRLTRRIWPHHMDGEGHFLALLEKEGAGEEGPEDTFREKTAKKAGRKASFRWSSPACSAR